VRFSVSADQALADRFAEKPADAAKTAEATRDATPAEPGPAAEAAPKAETRRSFEEVKAEADELNERLGNWVYTLPDFKGEQLTRKIEDLLQPKPPGK
jgi:nucleoid-associated protein YgaU